MELLKSVSMRPLIVEHEVSKKCTNLFCSFFLVPSLKLDGVGPVDKRPSTDKLHHFV